MRRRLQRRSQLVRAKSAAKNEIHAALMQAARPKARRSATCSARRAGGGWPSSSSPAAERESVSSAVRQIEFCESEIAAIEKLVAEQALASAEIRRLMSVPGVGAITAAAFMAAVGDIRRFPNAKNLVGYLGLDPIVRQSGSTRPATGGSQSRARPPAAMRSSRPRGAWSRRRGRCAPSMSAPRAGAAPRWRSSPPRESSPACFGSCWSRGEDYAYTQPSLTTKKLRRLELTAGARKGRGGAGVWKANAAVRDAERKMAEQAEAAYRRNVAEFKRVEALRAKQRKEAEKAQAEQQQEEGAGATSGRAS